LALFLQSIAPLLALLAGLLVPAVRPTLPPRAEASAQRRAPALNPRRDPTVTRLRGPAAEPLPLNTPNPKAEATPEPKAEPALTPADSSGLPDEVFVIQVGNDSLARLRHLRTPWRDRADLGQPAPPSPLYLRNPSNVQTVVELAPDGQGFYIYERVGGRDVRPPTYMTRAEYTRMQRQRQQADYFRKKSASSAQSGTANRLVPALNVNNALFRDIFGSGKIDIRPNVTALLDLSARTNEQQNPSLNLRQQANTFFDFRQQLQMNVVGTIGERLRVRANYDTEASFNFENQFKVEYLGQEDDIVKRIEAGNVSLPLNSSLITGGQNLWGVKAAFQLGPVMVTAVASQQRGRTNEIVVRNGAQQTEFNKKAHEYDENRHFFLNHYFRGLYERSLQRLPVLLSPIKVTRIEVYVTNRSNAATQNNRNAVGFVDLGENDPMTGGRVYNAGVTAPFVGALPENSANDLYRRLTAGNDALLRNRQSVVRALNDGSPFTTGSDTIPNFELVENMRRLAESEYVLNPELGYVSLNQRLQPNDVVFVAYEYTSVEAPGRVFRVGEFSNDVPADQTNNNVLFLKMLKPSENRPVATPASGMGPAQPYPTWDLMMKNVYSLTAFNLQKDGFRLDITYESTDGQGDINYLPVTNPAQAALAQRPIIQLVRLDRLTNNVDAAGPDSRFDFLPGITIVPDKGFIIFPTLEPFGRTITDQLTSPADDSLFGYPQLYRLTQMDALQLHPQRNRYRLRGLYASAGGQDIQLNAVQIVPGSVRVTANGAPLVEGSDYIVDYQIGRVTLLNQGVRASGAEIRINFESNTLFGIDQKTLLGSRIDYKVSRNLQLGATLLYLNERPLINKIVIGEEPMANFLWGLDVNWSTQSQRLTRLLDGLPFYSTTAPSDVALRAEFAQLRPGFPSQISTERERGISYIDDFEGTATFLDLGNQVQNWVLASRPQRSPALPPLSGTDSLESGYRRARLSWYQIDARFFDRPQDFGLDNQSPALNNPYSRRVSIPELFPNRTIAGTDFLQTFDLQYTPDERGPYNFAATPSLLQPDGRLTNPAQNWAGIMRRTTGQTDFEAANFEFIEFWMLDPYLQGANPGGDLYLNLGKISEDLLPDGRRSFENGLPRTAAEDASAANLSTTEWGRVPNTQVPTNAFDNSPEARAFQDVGYDGLSSERERTFFAPFLSAAQAVVVDPAARERLVTDPSGDDYRFFGDAALFPSGTDILTRYQRYANPEGNTPLSNPGDNFSRAQTLLPDVEDINQDNTLNTTEAYYEYRVSLRPSDLTVGQNFIIDRREARVRLRNGRDTVAIWYQFRVPLREGVARGSIPNFKAIDFIRLYMTQFAQRTTLRFANFRIISTAWRSLPETLRLDSIAPQQPKLALATVSIEENSSKTPHPYVVPPDIQRQGVPASPIPNQLQNEQSLQLRIEDLGEAQSRAVYKNVNLDLRFYERLKMWVHAEAIGAGNFANPGDATVYIRLGSDFDLNYYEYEVPLSASPMGSSAPFDIWPLANQIDLRLQDFSDAKIQRNVLGIAPDQRYAFRTADGRILAVRGNPQLHNVRTITIGVRNPRQGSLSSTPSDNGQPVSIEVWVNELRVTDFDQSAGWAASGRMNIKLADLGSLSVAGAYSTPGFGGVERRIFERTLEFRKQYDVATNLQLGRLLPKKLGLELPVFFSYGERIITPKWNPYDPDVLLASQLEITPQARRGDAEAASIDYQRSYSYAFNNVRRVRQDPTKKAQLWDIENFAFSYSFSENYRRNAQIERRVDQQYRGGITWSHNFNPKLYEPFKKWLGGRQNLITAFNFYLLPQNAMVSFNAQRLYEEEQLRDVSGVYGSARFRQPAYYFQDFQMTRNYALRWDLTRSLGLNYTSTVTSRVDEPRGRLDTPEKRDTLWRRFFDGGRTLNFNQNITANYRLPFDKIKQLNWVSSSLNYGADYRWQSAAIGNDSLGNTLGNAQNIQGQAALNLGTFYRKFPAIQRLLKPIPRKTIYSLRDSTRQEGDYWRVAGKNLYKALANIFFSIQNIDVSLSTNASTTLPGFLPSPSFFGNAYGYTNPANGMSGAAPGWDFILGAQPELTPTGWLRKATERGWLSTDPRVVQGFQQTTGYTFSGRTSVSLFKGFRVDLSVQQSRNENTSGVFRFDTTSGIESFVLANQNGLGTFSMSYFSLHTAFDDPDRLFAQFDGPERQAMSSRLRFGNPNYSATLPGGRDIRLENGFWNGYTGSSQDVLIPAFLSTYGPNSTGGVLLSPFPKIPLPNWNVNYTGLSEIWFLKELFKQVTLTHGYRSTYTANYQYNLRANDANGDGFVDTRVRIDSVGVGADTGRYNFQPGYVIQSVIISESLSPLLGINLALYNGVTLQFDYKQTRILTLNVGALQLVESRNRELTLNLAWTRQRTSAPLRLFGSFIEIKNQLTTRFELTVRDTRTQNRRLDSSLLPEPTQGNFGYTIKPSVDYNVSQQLTARAYYELSVNRPVLSTSFPTRFTAWGVQIRFTIQ